MDERRTVYCAVDEHGYIMKIEYRYAPPLVYAKNREALQKKVDEHNEKYRDDPWTVMQFHLVPAV